MKFNSNKTKRLVTTSILAVTAGLFFAAEANAGGFYLQEQSVKANGRAWSGEVSEQGAEQLWWNPAAIGGISNMEMFAGVSSINPRGKVSNQDTRVVRAYPAVPTAYKNLPVGGTQVVKNPVENGALPTGAWAMPINDKLAVGVVLSAPFSVVTDYDPDSWARYNADETNLLNLDLQPTIAYKVTPNLSLGLGLNIDYLKATLSNYLPDPLPGYADGHQSLKGDGIDYGYSLGLQYHNDKYDFGLSYKSAIEHKLDGTLTIAGLTSPVSVGAGLNKTIDTAKANVTFPWQANIGFRYHVNENTTFNMQVSRFGWSQFDYLTLSNLGPMGTQKLPFLYEDSTAVSVGIDHKLNDKLTIRGGIQADQTPISTGHRDPRVPDGDRTTLATGATYKLNDKLSINTSLGYTMFKNVPIDKYTAAYAGTAIQTTILTNGQLSDAHALTFGLGMHMTF